MSDNSLKEGLAFGGGAIIGWYIGKLLVYIFFIWLICSWLNSAFDCNGDKARARHDEEMATIQAKKEVDLAQIKADQARREKELSNAQIVMFPKSCKIMANHKDKSQFLGNTVTSKKYKLLETINNPKDKPWVLIYDPVSMKQGWASCKFNN
jgi:hypothetical protein